ncbi:secondary thiamine-phosphate synthase enzyme YjbQ [Methanosphaera sp. BMS]|uniref:secondary thiamine-phosphate synthase enzyme YjbQ n=1 Tax=Methanosphaera sp. BMS TaxID=1789762 RepID=UPI001955129A|nr:secondary thiamine-phosphate synthase enzyme YjbQ [Methanosphaera sp. BMS]
MIIESITIDSAEKCELINITSNINEIIGKNNVESGLVNISTRHTTSGIIINEDESGLKEDIVNVLEEIIPYKNYLHDRIDNNARSHLMATITTPTQTLPIVDGRLSLGTWQSIFFLELDGPRLNRKVTISILRD